jgi:hypothetical protein
MSLQVQSNGWVRIRGASDTYRIINLEASSNLVHWQSIATVHGWIFEFADPVSRFLPLRFYRFSGSSIYTDWKNTITLPLDEFFANHASVTGGNWIKFAILTSEPARVYYADGSRFLLHYDFAIARLPPLMGMSQAEFDQAALYNDARQVILGAVIRPSDERISEYGIQFVSHDPLPREMVRDLFELVQSTVICYRPMQPLYIPSFEQLETANTNRSWFASQGITVASTARWVKSDTCYAVGWAIGTLKFFAATEINAAYADGRLLPTDILITDGIPSELPYVAGIISTAPATPNSHVAILARSYHVPFVHLWQEQDQLRVLQLVGQAIVLQAQETFGYNPLRPWEPQAVCTMDIYPLDPTLDPALKAEMLTVKNATPININPIAPYGVSTAPTDNLVPADTRFFGGKAANYGLLRRTIPSNAPIAVAISFDLWTEFMAQTLSSGKTLRQEISNRLAGLTYPDDINAIKVALDSIRTLIRRNTLFTASQEQAIIAALSVFDSRKNIRFRSSTNVEDTQAFTGAGLYDSYSGCLDDDLDSDNAGPSHCDPTEEEERGVFRAIRRVYASFYNDNAYLERLRRNLDENTVGMAMLVHHSTPDDIELANGVATVSSGITADPGQNWYSFRADLVSQTGATSVANPEGSAVPEVVQADVPHIDAPLTLNLIQPSNLIPLGQHVLDWQSDYLSFANMFSNVTRAYRQMMGKQGEFQLDFEYKKVKPDWLEVKQVREIPLVDKTNLVSGFLLNEPITFVPYQGNNEEGPFANHRLKSRWTVRTRNLRLVESNLSSSIFTELTIEHLNGGRIETLSGPIQSFSNYAHSNGLYRTPEQVSWLATDSWRMSSLEGPTDIRLESGVAFFYPKDGPLLQSLSRHTLPLNATYDHPVFFNTRRGSPWRTNETITLQPDPKSRHDDETVTNMFIFSEHGTNITFVTTYRIGSWEVYNFSPPLVGTLQTRIEGLTADPIILTNYYSQTLDLGHLGAGPQFLFEPRLQPSVPAAAIQTLDALDIRVFYVRQPGYAHWLMLIGADGVQRRFGVITNHTLTVTVTRSDEPPFPPAGTSHNIFFRDETYCVITTHEGQQWAAPYYYDRKLNTANLHLDGQVQYVLTFQTPTTGTVRSANDAMDGTFTLR